MLMGSLVQCAVYLWQSTTAEGSWSQGKMLQAGQHMLNGITNGIGITIGTWTLASTPDSRL